MQLSYSSTHTSIIVLPIKLNYINFTFISQLEPTNFVGQVEYSIIIALSYRKAIVHVHLIAYEKLNTKFHWIFIHKYMVECGMDNAY